MPKRAAYVTPSPRRVRSRYSTARRTRAATRIQRAWRKKRSSNRSRAVRIGTSIWTANCKSRVTANQDAVTRTDNTLWGQEITDCTQGSEMDQRERGIINCRGFKIDMSFISIVNNQALYMNFAIIAPKRPPTTAALSGDSWFRGNGQFRAINFIGSGDSPFTRHTRNINPDEYVILKHWRFILAPSSASAGAYNLGSRSSVKHIKAYIKLNRAITYEAQESSAATDGMVSLAYWGGRVGSVDGVPQTNAFLVSERVVMYFKEPKQ